MDLFSGIGGNSIALRGYARAVLYCESDRHAQSVLLSRMSEGRLPLAPICSDIRLLDGRDWRGFVDLIVAGFPCQDISTAGKGAGLGGERSGLFFEIMRLAEEVEPAFLFLENVPAIRTRGLDRVIQELTALGYDCRWTMLSASEVGAPHKRERWFLLAYSKRFALRLESRGSGGQSRRASTVSRDNGEKELVAETGNIRRSNESIDSGLLVNTADNGDERTLRGLPSEDAAQDRSQESEQDATDQLTGASEHTPVLAAACEARAGNWWNVEPNVGRVAHGIPQRVDRIKRLGNAVVPLQARTAFEYLMGMNID